MEECSNSVRIIENSLKELGFIINEEKSQKIPTQELTFLGYILNSVNMTIKPPQDKKDRLIKLIDSLRGEESIPIRKVARTVGVMVDLTKGVQYGLAHYK